MYVGIFMQVESDNVSDSRSALLQNVATIRHQMGENAQCGCRRTERIRCLPGLNHVTYGWMPSGRRRSFLEISYSDNPTNSQCDSESQLPAERFPASPCKSCSTVKKPGEQCTKWPVHSSLTLICDSRPCHTSVQSRRFTGTAGKRRVPQEQCNKWPVHTNLTLICDSRPCHTLVQTRFVGPQSVPGNTATLELDEETETNALHNNVQQ